MANPAQFGRLLKEVRGATSPVGRMRVLARAWRTLQQLSPTERASLATEVGIDGAEEIVERMASKYGRLKPAFILQALEKARGAEPAQLRDFFRGLRDPRRRSQILQRGLEAITSEPGDKTEPVPERAPPAPAAPAPPKTPASSGAAKVATVAAARAATVATVAKAKNVPSSAPPQDAPKPEPPGRPAEVSTAAPAPASPKPEPARVYRLGPTPGPPRPKTPPTVARPPAPRPSPPTAPAVARRAERPPLFEAGVMQPLGADDLIARVEGAGSLIRRLRVLRSNASRARGLNVEALRRLLDLFQSPWARRRALIALLEHRVPGDLGDALDLIEDLDSPSARRWCLGTILDKWTLSKQDRTEVLALRRRPGDRAPATSGPAVGSA